MKLRRTPWSEAVRIGTVLEKTEGGNKREKERVRSEKATKETSE